MFYLILTDMNREGCYALPAAKISDFAKFRAEIQEEIGYKNTTFQLVTLNKSGMFGEYEPYWFVESEKKFREKARCFRQPSN